MPALGWWWLAVAVLAWVALPSLLLGLVYLVYLRSRLEERHFFPALSPDWPKWYLEELERWDGCLPAWVERDVRDRSA